MCDPCALRSRLDKVIPPEQPGAIVALRGSILRGEPLTTRRWIDRSEQVLGSLNRGHIPLTHEAFDTMPQRKAAEYLRALLIACDVLPPDAERNLRQFESRIPGLLEPLDPEHQSIVVRWLQWRVLPAKRRTKNEFQRPQRKTTTGMGR